jgi:hypothetical protein
MSIQNEEAERRVVIGADISDEEAKRLLEDQSAMEISEEAIPKFTQVSTKSFKAEFAVVRGDIVLHFFLPKHAVIESPESRQAWMNYWLKTFPAKLDPVAKEYFEADYPRIMAKYTPEVASWWFKAQGFGDVLDVAEFLSKFFEKLDAALQERS